MGRTPNSRRPAASSPNRNFTEKKRLQYRVSDCIYGTYPSGKTLSDGIYVAMYTKGEWNLGRCRITGKTVLRFRVTTGIRRNTDALPNVAGDCWQAAPGTRPTPVSRLVAGLASWGYVITLAETSPNRRGQFFSFRCAGGQQNGQGQQRRASKQKGSTNCVHRVAS